MNQILGNTKKDQQKRDKISEKSSAIVDFRLTQEYRDLPMYLCFRETRQIVFYLLKKHGENHI